MPVADLNSGRTDPRIERIEWFRRIEPANGIAGRDR